MRTKIAVSLFTSHKKSTSLDLFTRCVTVKHSLKEWFSNVSFQMLHMDERKDY